ncbi:hypothetical protein ASC97_26240 [Rhizobium sp. Root1203]|uniref:hypothetical protein n=1 Tax=Rhizobium sp. Root1203 TaxID=1736427 RepID=UPI00070AF396|nr:hypothetical protein [Rhizobium sp. Root1203]KQV24405.1 hypothetical protein ASC97_26240 [Rhizobium sp. Root1203]
MPLTKSSLSLLVLVALATTSCQTEDKPPQPRFVSDATGGSVGTASQKREGQYFIEFRSRYALSYGHTYVVFGRLNKAGGVATQEVAGLAPSGNVDAYVLGHFVPVPATTGVTDGDLEEEYRSASWRVLLTQAEYNKVVASIRQLQAKSKVWQASVSNCNNFVGEIAASMGYKTPSIWLRPQQFVTKLREMNTAA